MTDPDAPTVPLAPEALAAAVTSSTQLAAGLVLDGRYRIVRFVARGGMGAVYEAFDQELGVAVALKTIRPDVAWAPATVERFKREIQLARTVTHPGVCRIFDLGRHGDGDDALVFLTMELLQGETLAERLRRGRLAPADARTVIAQIAAALDAAHAAGVVHRDLKPANVILVARGAVVTDFGLARQVSATEVVQPLIQPLINPGEVVKPLQTAVAGTPGYMAPEQLAGEAIGPAADVYALGVVMEEVIDGAPPAWTAAIRRCQAPRPADRFASGAEVVAAIAPRRRRWPALAAVATALALAALVAWWAWPRAGGAHDAEAQRLYRDGEARLRDGDELTAATLLRRAIAAEPGHALAHAELAAALLALGDSIGARAEAEAASTRSGALAHEDAVVVEARLREARSEWTRAIELYQELRRIAPDEPEYLLRLTTAQLRAGDYRAVTASIDELHRRGVDHPRVPLLEAYLASRTAAWPALVTAARATIDAADRAGAGRIAALAYDELGNAQANLGAAGEARAALDESARRFHALGDAAGEARVIYHRAVMTARDDRAAALVLFEDALARYRALGNRDGQAMALVASAMYGPTDRLDDALAKFDEALALYRELDDPTNVANTLLNLASVHYKLGDHARFRAALDEVLEQARRDGVPATEASAAINLGIVTLAEADPPRARVLLDEAAGAARGLGDPTIDAYVHWALAEVARARADDDGARAALAATLAQADQVGDPAPIEQARCAQARLVAGGDVIGVCGAASAALEAVGYVDEAAVTAWQVMRAHLARGDRAAAEQARARVTTLAAQSQDVHTALTARLAAAELAGDRVAIEAIATDATTIGALELAFEARFALGLAQQGADREATLETLEAEATARSMTALARRCAVARRRR